MLREVRWHHVEASGLKRAKETSGSVVEEVAAWGVSLACLKGREEDEREAIEHITKLTSAMVEPMRLNLFNVPLVLTLEPLPSTKI